MSDNPDLTFRQFVGDLGNTEYGRDVELHVRYGVNGAGQYEQWSIATVMTEGPVEAIVGRKRRRQRRIVRRFRTVGSQLVRQQFSPAGGPPEEVAVVAEIPDAAAADALYDETLRQVSAMVAQTYSGGDTEPHRVALFGYASQERDTEFQRDHPAIVNVVVAVESDTLDEAVTDRLGHYFPGGATLGVFYPERSWFAFRTVGRGGEESPTQAGGASDTLRLSGEKLTVGMLIDSMDHDEDDWQIPDDWTL